jgi:hypothetical protein
MTLPTEGLRRDHREFVRLLNQYEQVPPEQRDARHQILMRIQRRLFVHFTLEEEILSPALGRFGAEAMAVSMEDARRRYGILRQFLSDLDQTDGNDPDFAPKLRFFREYLDEYARAEEEDLYLVTRPMTVDQREELRSRLFERRRQLLGKAGSPAPGTQPSP